MGNINQVAEWKEKFPKPGLFQIKDKAGKITGTVSIPMHRRKKRPLDLGTVKQYNQDIKKYLDYLTAGNLDNNMVSVIDFFNDLKEQTTKANTHKLCKAGLKAGFLNIPKYKNDLHFKMIIDSAFNYLETEQPNLRINKNSVINETELKELFDNTPDRLSCLIQFCYSTACRISEALNARVKNVTKN
ncbi:unnamed protein product, partial [marine sediment metagenome]